WIFGRELRAPAVNLRGPSDLVARATRLADEWFDQTLRSARWKGSGIRPAADGLPVGHLAQVAAAFFPSRWTNSGDKRDRAELVALKFTRCTSAPSLDPAALQSDVGPATDRGNSPRIPQTCACTRASREVSACSHGIVSWLRRRLRNGLANP